MSNTAGQLVVVATPLGNLGDLSPRALDYLKNAVVVYCEDTRHSRVLFAANHIDSKGRLVALHEHNEASMAEDVVRRVEQGDTVVLISDAGTPGISDPGARVVAAVANKGLVVTTAPGPSAVVAALSISGLPSDRFVMEGFLPRKDAERRELFSRWLHESRTIAAYESPQRLVATLKQLAEVMPDRQLVVCRELTKMHEEVVRGSVSEIADNFATRSSVLGEIVIVLAGTTELVQHDPADIDEALSLALSSGLSLRDAAAMVADVTGVSRRDVYSRALQLKPQ